MLAAVRRATLLTEFGPNMTTFVMPSELCPVAIGDRARDPGRRRQARRLHRILLPAASGTRRAA